MQLKIELTPVGHYFLGTERSFKFDGTRRQAADTYFIKSKEIPSQTTLFGTFRYLIGVDANEKLKSEPDSKQLIGTHSFEIINSDDKVDHKDDNYGIIHNISPLYLAKDVPADDSQEYYIRTPLDHRLKIENEEKDIVENNNYKTPLVPSDSISDSVYNFPESEVSEVNRITGYDAKDGLTSSWMSVNDSHQILKDSEVFSRSVEVVSDKTGKLKSADKSEKSDQKKDDKDDLSKFAKKEYIRMKKGFHFVFFADVACESDWEKLCDHKTAIMGKDSSVFGVRISKESEPDISPIFSDRPDNYIYFQSDSYIAGGAATLYQLADNAIIENTTMRVFVTQKNNKQAGPRKNNDDLINLIKAGSIVYLKSEKDKSSLTDDHANIVGMNRIISGGTKNAD